jgi:hypothetical protein
MGQGHAGVFEVGVWGRFLVSGFWFLVSGFWFLVSGFWFLVSGFWSITLRIIFSFYVRRFQQNFTLAELTIND